VPADKERFDKIMALAIDPGAHEGEALAAFSMLRKFARENPSLTAPPTPPPAAPPPVSSSIEWRLTKLPPFWMPITVSNLSEQAYSLGLRSKFVFDFKQIPAAVDIRCDGPEAACKAFSAYLTALIEWTNTQPTDPTYSAR
jgi:hypothetical protein